MIRVFVVAAYASMRAGLQSLIAGPDDFTIVGEASGSGQLKQLLAEAQPDVVLYDYHDDDATQVLDVISTSELGLVMLSDSNYDYHELVGRPFHGWACLTRTTADGPSLSGAIRGAAAGLIVLDRTAATHLRSPPLISKAESGSVEPLTPRELQVLQLMAQGLTNKSIATKLDISLHTVKFHVASILSKLAVASRTEAVALGARLGYVIL